MKIQSERQQPAAAQQAVEKKGNSESRNLEKTAAKRPRKKDTVELSASLDAELKTRQSEQTKRVDSIKAMIRGGDYVIDSTEVARKMLSRK